MTYLKIKEKAHVFLRNGFSIDLETGHARPNVRPRHLIGFENKESIQRRMENNGFTGYNVVGYGRTLPDPIKNGRLVTDKWGIRFETATSLYNLPQDLLKSLEKHGFKLTDLGGDFAYRYVLTRRAPFSEDTKVHEFVGPLTTALYSYAITWRSLKEMAEKVEADAFWGSVRFFSLTLVVLLSMGALAAWGCPSC